MSVVLTERVCRSTDLFVCVTSHHICKSPNPVLANLCQAGRA